MLWDLISMALDQRVYPCKFCLLHKNVVVLIGIALERLFATHNISFCEEIRK